MVHNFAFIRCVIGTFISDQPVRMNTSDPITLRSAKIAKSEISLMAQKRSVMTSRVQSVGSKVATTLSPAESSYFHRSVFNSIITCDYSHEVVVGRRAPSYRRCSTFSAGSALATPASASSLHRLDSRSVTRWPAFAVSLAAPFTSFRA